MNFVDFFKKFGEIAEIIKQSVIALEEEITDPHQGKAKKEIIMNAIKELVQNETLWNRVIALVVSFLINVAAKKWVGSSGEDPS